jgi:ribosomal protein S18 acetylase RimI-like enzyme
MSFLSMLFFASSTMQSPSLEPINNRFTERLDKRGVIVQRGFDETVAAALQEGVNDPLIRLYTHDATRFRNPDLTQRWYENPNKRPTIYSLSDRAIAGVIWFSHSTSEFSSAPDSFAIRMYADSRNRGLAGDFLEAAHEDFTSAQDGSDTWLHVRRDNAVARMLYAHHGYQVSHESKRFLTMTRDKR